jgi:glycerol kinase
MYAFPNVHNPLTGTQESGMTLRDYFAAMAMQGILSNAHLAKENPMDRNLIAGTAYEVADAMMIARDA